MAFRINNTSGLFHTVGLFHHYVCGVTAIDSTLKQPQPPKSRPIRMFTIHGPLDDSQANGGLTKKRIRHIFPLSSDIPFFGLEADLALHIFALPSPKLFSCAFRTAHIFRIPFFFFLTSFSGCLSLSSEHGVMVSRRHTLPRLIHDTSLERPYWSSETDAAFPFSEARNPIGQISIFLCSPPNQFNTWRGLQKLPAF